MTYNQDGLTAELIDKEAVAISVESVNAIEMTLEELKAVYAAIMEEVEDDD